MMTSDKNAEISRRILAMMASGMSLEASIDAVLGAGAYERIAGDLYEALRGSPASA